MVAESIVKPSKTHRMKEPEEGFDMAILPPSETGLSFVVFILQDMGIIPEVRIEIARSHRVLRSETVKVAIRPTVRLRDGYLDAHELALLTRWVDLNRDALIKDWGGEIESTSDVLGVLKPIAALWPSAGPIRDPTGQAADVALGPRKVSPFYRLFPVFPTCRNVLESLGRAGAVYPPRLSRLGSRITLAAWICNCAAATNVVFGRKRRQWRWRE